MTFADSGTSSPIVTVLVAFIAAAGSVGGVWLTRRVNQVHVLVNSKMSDALARIESLETQIRIERGKNTQRDER